MTRNQKSVLFYFIGGLVIGSGASWMLGYVTGVHNFYAATLMFAAYFWAGAFFAWQLFMR